MPLILDYLTSACGKSLWSIFWWSQGIIVDKSIRTDNRGVPITSTPTYRDSTTPPTSTSFRTPRNGYMLHTIPVVPSEVQIHRNPRKKSNRRPSQYSGVTETRHTQERRVHTVILTAISHLPPPRRGYPTYPHISPKGNCGRKRLCTISRGPLSPIFSPLLGPYLFSGGGEGRLGRQYFCKYCIFYGRLGGTVLYSTRLRQSIDSESR